ncbi:MAG: DsrE family protein [Nitrospirae bacterium]|nr:DsrE family protein [Nitrospirota bacterium]
MERVAVILKKPPYGDIYAAEALRHVMGAVADDLAVDLILVDSGVFLAMKGQESSGTGFINLEETLRECMDLGVEVYAERSSVGEQRLAGEALLDGVRILDGAEIAERMKAAVTTLIF